MMTILTKHTILETQMHNIHKATQMHNIHKATQYGTLLTQVPRGKKKAIRYMHDNSANM